MLSPLPPEPTGVADYVRDLAPWLAEHLDLTLYHPRPESVELDRLPVRPMEEFLELPPSTLCFYQMGNNRHHHFVSEQASRRPGVLVLHDLVLHHYYIEQTLARGDEDGYQKLLSEIYGHEGRVLARGRVDSVFSELQQFCHPLFEPLAGASRGVLVHNHRAARLVREAVPEARVAVAPMGMPERAADSLPPAGQARRVLGIDRDDFVVGVFGFLTPMKRPEVIFEAFQRLHRRQPRARLVVVGEVSPVVERGLLEGDGAAAARAHFAGYVDPKALTEYVAATDLFVNLRYPTAGETSASLLRLMAWGKPVVVTQYAQFREFPADVVWQLAAGAGEVEELAGLLAALADRPQEVARRGRAAGAWVREHCRLDQAADIYRRFGESVAEAEPPGIPMARFTEPTSRTPSRLEARLEAGPLPARVQPGEPLELEVEVGNRGDTIWLAEPRAFGGHVVLLMLAQRGDEAPVHLAWKRLPADLAPGDRVRLQYVFEAPAAPGQYRLLLDLFAVGHGEFGSRGSELLAYTVEVGV
jgi:glycosyltransferase involved in cell wall biosynthesis